MAIMTSGLRANCEGYLDEFADAGYHGPEGSKVKLSCWKDTCLEAGEDEMCIVIDCDDEDIDAKLSRELHTQATIRRRNQLLDEMVTGVQGQHAAGGNCKKRKEKFTGRKGFWQGCW